MLHMMHCKEQGSFFGTACANGNSGNAATSAEDTPYGHLRGFMSRSVQSLTGFFLMHCTH